MEQNKLTRINLTAWFGLAIFAIFSVAASILESNSEVLWLWLPFLGIAVGFIFGLWATIKRSNPGLLALVLSVCLGTWYLLASTGL